METVNLTTDILSSFFALKAVDITEREEIIMKEIENWIVVEKYERNDEISYNLKPFLYNSLEIATNKVKRLAKLKAETLDRDIIKMHCQFYIAVEYYPNGLVLVRDKDGIIESYKYYSKKIVVQLDED